MRALPGRGQKSVFPAFAFDRERPTRPELATESLDLELWAVARGESEFYRRHVTVTVCTPADCSLQASDISAESSEAGSLAETAQHCKKREDL